MKKITLLLCLTLGVSLQVTAKGDAEAGKAKITTCVACHGTDGKSLVGMNPNLAGQHEKYLLKQLKEFKLGADTGGKEGRNNAVMFGMVASLTEQDMQDLAAYYSSLPAVEGTTPEDVIEPGQKLYRGGDLDRGITACIACHGPRGNGMGLANFPDISGQHAEYIKSQLENFRSGIRNNDQNGMMRDIAVRLTDKDIEILSKYLGGLH